MIGVGLIYWNATDLTTIFSFDFEGFIETGSVLALLAIYVLMFPLFWCSGRMFGLWWDSYVDMRKGFKRITASKQYKQNLEFELQALINELHSTSER